MSNHSNCLCLCLSQAPLSIWAIWNGQSLKQASTAYYWPLLPKSLKPGKQLARIKPGKQLAKIKTDKQLASKISKETTSSWQEGSKSSKQALSLTTEPSSPSLNWKISQWGSWHNIKKCQALPVAGTPTITDNSPTSVFDPNIGNHPLRQLTTGPLQSQLASKCEKKLITRRHVAKSPKTVEHCSRADWQSATNWPLPLFSLNSTQMSATLTHPLAHTDLALRKLIF